MSSGIPITPVEPTRTFLASQFRAERQEKPFPPHLCSPVLRDRHGITAVYDQCPGMAAFYMLHGKLERMSFYNIFCKYSGGNCQVTGANNCDVLFWLFLSPQATPAALNPFGAVTPPSIMFIISFTPFFIRFILKFLYLFGMVGIYMTDYIILFISIQ